MLTSANVSLVAQRDQLGGGQLPDDAPDSRRGQIMHAAGQRPRHPQDLAGGRGDDLQVHAVAAVLAGVERAVFGNPVDGNQRPVDHHERVPGPARRAQRRGQLRSTGASSRTVSVTYRQAVAVPTPNPAPQPQQPAAVRRCSTSEPGDLCVQLPCLLGWRWVIDRVGSSPRCSSAARLLLQPSHSRCSGRRTE